MQVKVVKNLSHAGRLWVPGELVFLEDSLVDRLVGLGVVTTDLEGATSPQQPTAPQKPAEPVLPADGEIVDDKKDTKVGDVEEGGSEDETGADAQAKTEGADIEDGGSEDKETAKTEGGIGGLLHKAGEAIKSGVEKLEGKPTHDELVAEATEMGLTVDGKTDEELEAEIEEANTSSEQIEEQATALGIDLTDLSPEEVMAKVDAKETELGIDFMNLEHEQIMEAIKTKLAEQKPAA